MIDYVKRLKASQAAQPRLDYERGKRAGIKWAQNHAEWRELERLAFWRDEDDFEKFVDYRWFRICIDPTDEKYPPGKASCALHDKVFGEECYPDPEFPGFDRNYIRGFWDGAVEVYKSVELLKFSAKK